MSKQYPGGLITKSPVTPSGPYTTDTASGIWTLDQQAYWAKLGQWPTAGNLPKDAQFNYVTMLLHGDGTNGAQNNTFLDSSTNAFSITRNGNTTQGSFSPYGSNWSNWFNGGQDYFTIAGTSTACALPGDFTIEFWYFQTATVNYGSLFSTTTTYATTDSLRISTGNNNDTFEVASGGSGIFSASTSFSSGVWYHVALVRSGTTLTLYQNGVSVGSATNSQSFVSSTFIIGDVQGVGQPYRLKGYISNFRLVKGTAVYTAAFTPPTSPLTAITNTQLLTCQSSRFIDNSVNNFTITVVGRANEGHPVALKFNPFGASAAYSTSVVGGSFSSDGVVGGSDYLSVTVTGQSAGTASFTYELWFYETAHEGRDRHLFTTRTTDDNAGFDCRVNSNGTINLQRGGSTDFFTSTATANVACWNHLAIVRDGTTNLTIYLNGVSIGTSSLGYNFTATAYKIGVNYATDDPWKGYITDFRYTKAAVYTATFTPPTAPLTAITNTQLLLNTTNGAIFDNAMMNDLETVGNAQISTSVKKYGTGSLAFDGTGDCLTSNPALAYSSAEHLQAFGSGNFTIEMWFYITAFTNTYSTLYDSRPISTQGAYPTIAITSGRLYYYVSSAERIATANSAISTGQWYHLAVSRSGTSTKMFLDGTQVGSTYTDSTIYINGPGRPVIGAEGFNSPPSDSINGYIDDLRITKGYARYTATFTPPTAAFPDIGPN